MTDEYEVLTKENIRATLPVFERQQSFSELNEKYAPYRKSMLSLALFSLVINFSGITITQSNIGLVGGTIASPQILPFFIFLACLYSTILFVVFTSCEHKSYALSTASHIKSAYLRELGINNLTKLLQRYLKSSYQEITNLSFTNTEDRMLFRFSVTAKGSFKEDLIQDVISTASNYHYKIEPTENPVESINYGNKTTTRYFLWHFEPTEDDLNYIDRHYKYLRLKDRSNFIEIRLPVWVSIFALYSYILRFPDCLRFISL
ncbi:MAG: hypothetical protein MK175_04195 [Pseudoalteromonas sp.]|uniref:hypothetical protein n=1 Tax=Pseudoalteromonas sp. TaxID=53249 RepID=UPI0025F48FA3|nr:hypothetical protein [Pseudoalteromonas sp.]MCH2086367.1 hypothetical protein [Pseudoalteromonas sp.]